MMSQASCLIFIRKQLSWMGNDPETAAWLCVENNH